MPKEAKKVDNPAECPKRYYCEECGARMEPAGYYRECPKCGWKCRWFYNKSGLGDTGEMLDLYESL